MQKDTLTHELYNRCLLIPYSKLEKLAYKNKIIELYENNLLVSINHKYKSPFTKDDIVAFRNEILSENFRQKSVTYIATLARSS